MTRIDFVTNALALLTDEYPNMTKRLETERHIDRWFQRFGHLTLHQWEQTIAAYADDNVYAPTVNALARYTPKGSGPRQASGVCEHIPEVLPDGNRQCIVCHAHYPDCTCRMCACARQGHPGTHRDRGGRWWCPACETVLRGEPRLAAQEGA